MGRVLKSKKVQEGHLVGLTVPRDDHAELVDAKPLIGEFPGVVPRADLVGAGKAGGAFLLSVFLRGGFVPADRNLESWYIDGGVGVKGLLPGRADDTLTSASPIRRSVWTRLWPIGTWPSIPRLRENPKTPLPNGAIRILPNG